MKIVQITSGIAVGGITTFIDQWNKALKLAGHEVSMYFCPTDHKQKLNKLHIDGEVYMYDYDSKEMLDNINSCDYVFIHQFMLVKNNPEYLEKYNELIQNQITTKKIIFFNGHAKVGYKQYGIENFKNPDILNKFDYISTFNDNCAVSLMIRETLGDENYFKKYIHMQLPYVFNESIKENWVPFEEKKKRIAYCGRYTNFKHPYQLLNLYRCDPNCGLEFEMRGISRDIGSASVPDLFYELDPTKPTFKEQIVGKSKITEIIDNKWKEAHGIDKDDLMIDYPRENKIYVFGPYKREDGMKAIMKSMFNLECFRLKKPEYYGDNLEYVMFEIIEHGTIPVFDAHAGRSIHIYKDGQPTNETMYNLGLGLFLEPDASNAQEIIDQLIELSNNKEKYDELRNKCWDYYKEHGDPVKIINKFFKNIEDKKHE